MEGTMSLHGDSPIISPNKILQSMCILIKINICMYICYCQHINDDKLNKFISIKNVILIKNIISTKNSIPIKIFVII